jgi:ankyrin repeat protein
MRGFYPLDTAAEKAPPGSVKLLLAHGAPLGPDSRAMNAAAMSDVSGRNPVMALLPEHGANTNALAEDTTVPSEAHRVGRKGTPSHAAAMWGNKEMVAWLLEHGADPEVRDEVGETPAEWAKRFEKDGPERTVRMGRAIERKNRVKKEEESEENAKKVQEGGGEAA